MKIAKCLRCKNQLREVDTSRRTPPTGRALTKLYNGVICTECGGIECTKCKAENAAASCSWCGGKVVPAYANEIQIYQRTPSKKSKRMILIFIAAFISLAVTSVLYIVTRPASQDERALHSITWEERMQAVLEITDQEILFKVVKQDDSDNVRKIALERLTEEKYIREIYQDHPDPFTRVSAAEKLFGQKFIEQLARESTDAQLRIAAVEKLKNNEPILVEIFKNDPDIAVRGAALDHIKDEEMLGAFIMDLTVCDEICELAFDKITSQTILANIALNHTKAWAKGWAISKLTSTDVLETIAQDDPDAEVQSYAQTRLQEISDASFGTEEIFQPEILKRVEPVYPEAARRARIEGEVILEVTIDKQGKVKNVEVVKSIPYLDQAAIDAVKRSLFKPCVRYGRAMEVTFTLSVEFSL